MKSTDFRSPEVGIYGFWPERDQWYGCTKHAQGLQILLMSGVTVTSASQILESFWNIWSQVSQRKKPFSDFPARGPSMYTLSLWIHEVAVAVR